MLLVCSVTGCGGSTSSTRSTAASGKQLTATVYTSPTTGQKQEPSPPPPKAQNPCTLVTHAEAAVILRSASFSQTEAPLGPTCIFQEKGVAQSITLAVETVKVSKVIAQMKTKPAQSTIGGHPAFCGTLGSPLLFVDLGAGRALQIRANCPVAVALAAKAVPRIKP